MYPAQPAPPSRQFSEKSAMYSTRRPRAVLILILLNVCFLVASCSRNPASDTAVMLIESSPLNLDPRVGTDAQSERIDKLLFDALVHRDENFQVQPWIAERWEIPDPQTYIFHLRHDVRFHDGRQLTSADVKWTLDSIIAGKPRTPKTATFRFVDRIEAPDPWTLIIRMKEPYSSLLWNLSDGAIGIVPAGSGEEITRNPIGTGPFKFVSSEQDRQVVLARNDQYWGDHARIPNVRFM